MGQRAGLRSCTLSDPAPIAMLHPIFSLLIRRPELLADHVAGYSALVQEQVASLGAEVVARLLALVVAAVAAITFLTLCGVAIMMGTVHDEFRWSLVVVPGVALGVAVAGLLFARKPLTPNRFAEVKAQVRADAQALKAADAHTSP